MILYLEGASGGDSWDKDQYINQVSLGTLFLNLPIEQFIQHTVTEGPVQETLRQTLGWEDPEDRKQSVLSSITKTWDWRPATWVVQTPSLFI